MMEAGKTYLKIFFVITIFGSCKLNYPEYKSFGKDTEFFDDSIKYISTVKRALQKDGKTFVQYEFVIKGARRIASDSLLMIKNVFPGDRYSLIYSKEKQPDLSPPLRILLWHEPLKNPNKHYNKKEAKIEKVSFFRSKGYKFAEIHYSFILDDKRYTGIALQLIDKSTKSKYKKGNTIEVEYVIDNPENNNIFNNDSE